MSPRGSGTVSTAKNSSLCAIATAAHVVAQAHFWEEPVRIQYQSTGATLLLRDADRAIIVRNRTDTAALVFERGELQLPEVALELGPKDKHLRVGVDIGWLGFPASANHLCFFGGRIPAWQSDSDAYLVDGVAINGVSGGPAFKLQEDCAILMGIVSAYMPNRATGEVLPGLAVIQGVTDLHDVVAGFSTLDQAQSEQTPPSAVTVPEPEPSAVVS
jgi:hypothetical protein